MPRSSFPSAGPIRTALLRLLAGLAAVALLATGCQFLPGSSQPEDSGSAASDDGGQTPPLAEIGTSAAEDVEDPATNPEYASYYEQQLSWQECGSTPSGAALECADITVPRAWDDPSAGDIQLPLAKRSADGDSAGSLFLNPGGPGGSGVDFVSSAESMISPEVLRSYDVIGFDPRGVGPFQGLNCLDDAEIDEMRSTSVDMLTEQGREENAQWLQRLVEGCESDDADLPPVMDTLSAARDLDVMRAAVGEEQLDYLGFSYGTYLGATYAEQYPEQVGSFVLDGAIDPSLTYDEFVEAQAGGFEQAITTFLQGCLDSAGPCPFSGSVEEAGTQLTDLYDELDETPATTADPERPLNGALAESAVTSLMYEDAQWTTGYEALAAAADGDGTQLLQIADSSAGRQADGTYRGNINEVSGLINCLDHPAVEDEQWQLSEAQRMAEEYPLVGDSFGFSGDSCAQWPTGPVREPAEIHADGAGPILVIGTTGDPATPYQEAQALAEQLTSGVLLTYDGAGHTAYGRSGGCIEELVDAYLLEGTVPEDGATC